MRRPDAPTKREIAAWHNFYAAAAGKQGPEIPPARVRKPSTDPSEHEEQSAVIGWWTQVHGAYNLPPIALLAIPNAQILMGSARHPERVMTYLRREGFRKGAPDLLLAVMRRGFGSLYIEMKRASGGVQSVEQINFASYLNGAGYRCELCKGADSAIAVIKDYLG